jgi:hypothetical protein
MQKDTALVIDALPTPREIRGRLIAVKKAEQQAAFEKRLKCRELIFSKGNGSVKSLSPTEKAFCQSVWRESYRAYLEEFRTGIKSRYPGTGKRWRAYHDELRPSLRPNRLRQPMTALQHRLNWQKSQKARWIRFDVPNMMKQRMKEIA